MIGFALVLATSLIAAQSGEMDRSVAADWACATPLIERNYRRTMPLAERFVLATDLADRIADECTRPYSPGPIATETDRYFEQSERTIYGYNRTAFRREILVRIEAAVRRARIELD